MSRQFAKVLGTGSKPDVYKGAPGNPDIVVHNEVVPREKEDLTNKSLVANAPKQAESEQERSAARGVQFNRRQYGKNSRKRELKNLSTTTMRLNEKTGEAYDTEEVKPAPSGRVMPTRKANPKYVLNPDNKNNAEALRANEDLAARTSTPANTDEISDMSTGEAEFNKKQAELDKSLGGNKARRRAAELGLGGNLRSLNGVTYDINEKNAEVFKPTKNNKYTATGTFSDWNRREENWKNDVNAERNIPERPKAAEAVETSSAPVNVKDSGYRPSKSAGDIAAEKADQDLVTAGRLAEKGKLDSGSRNKRTPTPKPRTGTVIPQVAIDTFGSQKVDREQAELENKNLRENRTEATQTTVVDQNKTPSRPARGKTLERQAVLGGIREERAADLAAQGKTMTTVAPEVMDTAKRLGRTSHYNLTEDYMNSTGFLAHEAVQKATVAHALGVHHLLGVEGKDTLHQYLGGRPLEAKSRLAAAYKIVDRNRRGNPEKVPGEFALLHGMVHAGSGPTQTLRAVRSGGKTDVVVNGQTPVLAEGSSENRTVTHDKASKITAEVTKAPKVARGSVAASPVAPLAGTNRVAVRTIGQKPEEAEVREFSPQELRNKENVPTVDDSKSKLGPVEKEVEGESSDIVERLKKGPKRMEDIADVK